MLATYSKAVYEGFFWKKSRKIRSPLIPHQILDRRPDRGSSQGEVQSKHNTQS